MGELSSSAERRSGLRVPVRGAAVFYPGREARGAPLYGTIENLSCTGALVQVRGMPIDGDVEIELKLGIGTGRVIAHTVRVSTSAREPTIAVEFECVDESLRAAIEAAIDHAIRAAVLRPVLVIDERTSRRAELAARLAEKGMTPLAPGTPLEAMDLLTRAPLHVDVCLLAPSFGQTLDGLRGAIAESLPWVLTAEISDDLDATVERAVAAWSLTELSRFSIAVAEQAGASMGSARPC